MSRYLLALVVAVVSLQAQSAPVTYTYSGNALTSNYDGDPRTYAVTASFDLSDLLNPNLVQHDATPISYSLSDGWTTITNSTSGYIPEFRLSTDALGNIQEWIVGVALSGPLVVVDDTQIDIWTQHMIGVTADSTFFCVTAVPDWSTCEPGRGGFVYDNPGRWSMSAVPVPAAASLLASALGMLGWTRRRMNAT